MDDNFKIGVGMDVNGLMAICIAFGIFVGTFVLIFVGSWLYERMKDAKKSNLKRFLKPEDIKIEIEYEEEENE